MKKETFSLFSFQCIYNALLRFRMTSEHERVLFNGDEYIYIYIYAMYFIEI